MLVGIHAVIHGEVAADHVRLAGGSLAGELRGGVLRLGRVLAVVDASGACVASAGSTGVEQGFWPAAALADTYGSWLVYIKSTRIG